MPNGQAGSRATNSVAPGMFMKNRKIINESGGCVGSIYSFLACLTERISSTQKLDAPKLYNLNIAPIIIVKRRKMS